MRTQTGVMAGERGEYPSTGHHPRRVPNPGCRRTVWWQIGGLELPLRLRLTTTRFPPTPYPTPSPVTVRRASRLAGRDRGVASDPRHDSARLFGHAAQAGVSMPCPAQNV